MPVAPLVTGGTLGVLVGAWLVLRWGLMGRPPRLWGMEQWLLLAVLIALVLAGSRWMGVDRQYWLAFSMAFPLGFLPLVSVALSAHSYTGQSMALAATCGYLGVIQWVFQTPGASIQFLMAGVFAVMPAVFAWQGLLDRVQGWNAWFWSKIRRAFGLPAQGDSS